MSADEEAQRLKEFREKMKDKFTESEIDDFINMGKKLAGKPVLHALKDVIMRGPELGKSQEECNKICKRIDKCIPYNYCGYVSVSFKECPQYTLNVTLSLVEKDFVLKTDLPSGDYVRDLYEKFDFLKATAIAYWQHFMEEHPDLIKRIISYRDDVDFSKLLVDSTTKTTLYWDPDAKKRAGIFTYYLENGRPMYKKIK